MRILGIVLLVVGLLLVVSASRDRHQLLFKALKDG